MYWKLERATLTAVYARLLNPGVRLNNVGVDIVQGIGVDEICSADEILDKYGKVSFDIIISTEMLEHVKDWRKVVSNFRMSVKGTA